MNIGFVGSGFIEESGVMLAFSYSQVLLAVCIKLAKADGKGD